MKCCFNFLDAPNCDERRGTKILLYVKFVFLVCIASLSITYYLKLYQKFQKFNDATFLVKYIKYRTYRKSKIKKEQFRTLARGAQGKPAKFDFVAQKQTLDNNIKKEQHSLLK